SVIISTRNSADILPEALRALARQSFPFDQLEVVVVDDGSTDETAACVRDTRYPFRLVYERLEPREGFSPARPRNRGLRAATGDVGIFIDADILASAGLVAGHVAAHERSNAPCAAIGYTYGYALFPADRTPEALLPPPPEKVVEELPRLLAEN